jgi:hypothetical protein
MATRTVIKPGDKVSVPLGRDRIVGVALEVYGPRQARSVLVSVPVHGTEGDVLDESLISFPLEEVVPAA